MKGGRRVQRESDKSEASPQIQGDGGQEEGGSEQVAGFCPSTVTGKLGHPSEPHFPSSANGVIMCPLPRAPRGSAEQTGIQRMREAWHAQRVLHA